MIIECERCHTKFKLDENLLKETGSKVRCSVCQHKFILFPPTIEQQVEKGMPELSEEPVVTPPEELIKGKEPVSDFDKTLVGEIVEEPEAVPPEEIPKEEELVSDLDKTLAEEPGEEITQEEEIEPISFEDLSQLDSGIMKMELETPDIETAMDRATRAEEEIIAKEERERGEEVKKVGEPVKPQPVIKKRRKPGLLLTVLIIILLLVGATSALIIFKPDLLPESIPFFKRPLSKEQALDIGSKRLAFRGLKGSFVDSKKAGNLFVVAGMVTNNYPDKRNFIRVRSNILDSKGKVIKSMIVYAGNPISNKELQTLSMEEINNKLMNKVGKNKININILPKASIPFMIVFDRLPEDVSEFTVEAISSSPAKK